MSRNEDLTSEVVDTIQKNRISSTEVADALQKTGVLEGINAYNRGHFACGIVRYVCAYEESNWPLHEQIAAIDAEDTVLFVDTFGCNTRAVFGDLVSKNLFLYSRIQALVVNGYLRDAHRLKKENYPTWLKGVTPLGCLNKKVTTTAETCRQIEVRKAQFENGVLVCDDSGCTLIAPERINKDLLRRLAFIELQEDIWYYCIDTLKWSTFDTVCLKRYLSDPDVLPKGLRDKFEELKGE